jgi:two-component system, cell cycle sensor histidine kinase and response regulator CckA
VYLRGQEVASANRSLQTANAVLGRLHSQISLLLSQASELHLEPGCGHDWALLRDRISPEEILERVSRLILIADYQRMEDQLGQSQEMEAVGRLAGGVAHDFNNLLTVIAGYAALLREDSGADREQPELEEMENAAKRAAELTRQLLGLQPQTGVQPQVFDWNTVVSRMEGMLWRLIGEDIALVLAGDLGKVKADSGQIEQVIMNLAVNARDAMPGGGKLLIETRAAQLEAGQMGARAAGRYIQLSVSDTGHGMTAETASRIFEPFFTTKEGDQGTGLGLSTALGTVEQSGGTLTMESKLNVGTVFRVYPLLVKDQTPLRS